MRFGSSRKQGEEMKLATERLHPAVDARGDVRYVSEDKPTEHVKGELQLLQC